MPRPKHKHCKCGGPAYVNAYCGAYVCDTCGNHIGLARCYCGWAASGGDGRAELVAMGETIEDDDELADYFSGYPTSFER